MDAKKVVAWVLAVVGGLSAVATGITATDALHNRFGWMSPNSIVAYVEQTGLSRDEWKCDELAEEIDDLERRIDAGEDTEEQRGKLKEKRDLYQDKHCSQYEDW